MTEKNRYSPFIIQEETLKVSITFSTEVTAIAFFHNCKEIQSICETQTYDGHTIESIEFNMSKTKWFDTLALCYLLLFAWNAKHRLKINISFSSPQDPKFLSFLSDNGFESQIRNLANEQNATEIPMVQYSTLHKCFLPLHILAEQEDISDFIESVRVQMVGTFCDAIESAELDYTISKVAYFLQETLDNVYSHAYREKNKPCAVLIKHVYCEDGLDVNKYGKRYISLTPYLNVSLFENYEEYLEIYVADIGMGIRESFLKDPTGADSEISDENIIDYILTEGQRSHKRISRVPDTAFGGLYDIFHQFQEDGDSLGIKADGSWFFNGSRTERLNSQVLYKSYDQLMHGFALVAAIHINPIITERYEFVSQLSGIVTECKKIIFSDGNNSILKESLATTIVGDFRPKLSNVVANKIDYSQASISVRYPDVFWKKAKIIEKILLCKTATLIVAGIQESELKKYRSLVESFFADRGAAKKVIIVTNTLYVYVYNRNLYNKFEFSYVDTDNYIKCKNGDIRKSFLAFLQWDRAYNSACIWSLAKTMDSRVYLNDEIKWNKGSNIHGYLDFSQLCRIPLCRDFCINRLMVLRIFERDIYFQSIDRFTEEICEQANYQMGSSAEKQSIYIGSVFVSGSSSRMSTIQENQFYFFKHSNSSIEGIYSIFEWATRIEWINKSFSSNDKEKMRYARIGYSPFVANEGAEYWAKRHYLYHNNEYKLSQSEMYQILQRRVGIHPAAMHLGHFDCSDHHDLFGFRTTALYESDLNLNQIVPEYNVLSCSDFLITELIYALCGKCTRGFLINDVLSPNLSVGKRNAIVKKYLAAKKSKKKSNMGVVVYLYDFHTSNIMEKMVPFFSEKYQNRIIPIMAIDRDYSETALLLPPLLLDRMQRIIKLTTEDNQINNSISSVNATIFMATSFTIRVKEELQHVLLSIGASKVFLLTLLDRQRILLKSGDASSLISFGRIDLPALGSRASCPICNALELLRDVKNELINLDLAERLNTLLSRWEIVKESDNAYQKGIALQPIQLSGKAKENIAQICKLYGQGQFNIQTNIALAMFTVENAIISSSPDFLSSCIDNNELIVDEEGRPDEDMSEKIKILLLCSYLLSAGTSRTSDQQIAEYTEVLCRLVENQKDVSEYSGLAVITVCTLPSIFQTHLQDSFVKNSWNDTTRSLNFDALLIHLILYHVLCHRLNSPVNNDYANLLRCYFKAGKSQLDFIYEAFLYSEKDYKQSHVQALAQISASSQLDKNIYQKGSHYVSKIIELVTSKYYESLFHDPTRFVAQRDELKQKLVLVKEKLDKITESSSLETKIEAKNVVSDLLDSLHSINIQGVYLRVPSCEEERTQIEKWLMYCQQKAFERVPLKYRYKDIVLSIEMNSSFVDNFGQPIRIRPWFYSFNDVTEEIINVYVDMLKGASRKLLDKGITNLNAKRQECMGIIKLRFFNAFVEITFYNATENNKSIEEIQRIKDSKRSRSSLLAFREFERKFLYTYGDKEKVRCFNWEYVEDRFPECVVEGVHLFSATLRIPYIDMGSSSAFDESIGGKCRE